MKKISQTTLNVVKGETVVVVVQCYGLWLNASEWTMTIIYANFSIMQAVYGSRCPDKKVIKIYHKLYTICCKL